MVVVAAAVSAPRLWLLKYPIGIYFIRSPIWMRLSLTASLILRMIKLVKTRTEMEMAKAYIMCAVSSGASRFRILLGHVLPNIGKEIVRFSACPVQR